MGNDTTSPRSRQVDTLSRTEGETRERHTAKNLKMSGGIQFYVETK